jgi:hypothetical protein
LAFPYFHLHDEASSATGTHQPFSVSNSPNFHDLSQRELAAGRNCAMAGFGAVTVGRESPARPAPAGAPTSPAGLTGPVSAGTSAPTISPADSPSDGQGRAYPREHTNKLWHRLSQYPACAPQIDHRPAAATLAIIVLQSLCCISLGVHRNIQIAHTLRIRPPLGIPASAGKRMRHGTG